MTAKLHEAVLVAVTPYGFRWGAAEVTRIGHAFGGVRIEICTHPARGKSKRISLWIPRGGTKIEVSK